MLFLNSLLLFGLLGISIPIIIHLLNRKSSRVVQWGAMRFLRDSITNRTRKIQLEEALLLACRCLLVALLGLALARPFVQGDSSIPWRLLLPLGLLAVAGFGASFALWREVKWRRWLLLGSFLLLGICAGLAFFEKQLNLKRFTRGGSQDVAIVIDGSTSMNLVSGSQSNFDKAVDEARNLIQSTSRGTAYSLILGGSAPRAITPSPTTSREDLLDRLEELTPANGAMHGYDALTRSALELSKGFNPGKQIIVYTDGQKLGWETDSPSRWDFLQEALDNLPARPKLILRNLHMPLNIRNASVGGIHLSRDVIGIDRPVTVTITVENNGTEAVTPAAIHLHVGETKLTNQSVGQLVPGSSETVTFSHRFSRAGAHVLRAEIEVEDDLAEDNEMPLAVNVTGSLNVLLVNGRSDPDFLKRASSFAALALAPGAITRSELRTKKMNAREFLVIPEVVEAAALGDISSFRDYKVVILCNVPRLPLVQAEALVSFVNGGGGLLVAPGPKAIPDFYNNWGSAGGTPLLPARLQEQIAFGQDEDFLTPSLSTFTADAILEVADAGQSDFDKVIVSAYWKLETEESDQAVSVGARLVNGDPLLATRKLGEGSVCLLATGLDTKESNLPARRAFVPFMHEMVYWLSNPSRNQLNLEPGWEVTLPLMQSDSSQGIAPGSSGLQAEYFDNPKFEGDPVLTRVDPEININFDQQAVPQLPKDQFSVRWTGTFTPRVTGMHTLMAEVDDEFKLWLNGREMLHTRHGNDKSRKVELVAGEPMQLRAEFVEDWGNAYVRLLWRGKKERHGVIPSAAFSPDESTLQQMSLAAHFDAIGPDGKARDARLYKGARGHLAKVSGNIVSGLYRLKIPEDQQSDFRHLLSNEKDVPFTVTRETGESRMEILDDNDREFLRNYVDLLEPENSEQTAGILSGQAFGEELWKILALAALALLLLEIALSRWIAKARRTDVEEKVDFEDRYKPTDKFQEQLEKVRRSA